MTKLYISFVVPVYNRPDEVTELLQSLQAQTNNNFELVIVEDGSTQTCEKVLEPYRNKLKISYFYKENTGPGISRNYGVQRATGNYTIFVDSDCILPPEYVQTVYDALENKYLDCFGGPDKAHHSFTPLQKAINYSMTSFFTTGGIRGGGETLEKFHPRSFNMGFSTAVFEKTGGFPTARFAQAKAAGEDIELSIKIKQAGFSVGLIKQAYVYHKRRTSLKQFYKQVYNFGYARISLHKRNQGALKLVHFLPACFLVGSIFMVVAAIFIHPIFLMFPAIAAGVFFIDASLRTRSILIGLIGTLTSFIQLYGYGVGFLKGIWEQLILKKNL